MLGAGLFALAAGVVIPRNKHINGLIFAHLKLCALDVESEEGKFARYVMQVLIFSGYICYICLCL